MVPEVVVPVIDAGSVTVVSVVVVATDEGLHGPAWTLTARIPVIAMTLGTVMLSE